MRNKFMRIIAGMAALSMLMPSFCISADEITGETAEEQAVTSENDENEGSSDYVMRTENEVLKKMIRACENENLILFYSEEEDLIALENKKNGYVWWSSPINAEGDTAAKTTVKKELESSLVVVYGDPEQRTGSTLRSSKNAKMSYSIKGDTLEITYRFPAAGFIIPVKYTLEEKCLRARTDTSAIKENKRDDAESRIILELSVLPNMMAAGSYENGYYIIPDGCGAKINFNNGKTEARAYSAKVYGTDITAVPQTAPDKTEEVLLPVYSSVKDNGNALLAVISEGDSNVLIQSAVSGLNKSSYNTCSSRFILRNTDTYYMNSEPLTVFENCDLSKERLEIKFFPVSGRDTGCADVAAVYRQYLAEEEDVAPKNNRSLPLCVNFYGGVTKKEPFLGVPVTRKKALTTWEQAEETVTDLYESGVDEMVVSLENWTDDGITGKVDVTAKPSGVLGSSSEFKKMTASFEKMGVKFCPVVNNTTFSSGNGYWEFTDTAMRVSGQYSKQISFTPAYGTRDGLKKPQSLLSPAVFPEVFENITRSFNRNSIGGICPGDITTVLYGDYGKKHIERAVSEKYICDGLQKFDEDIGFVYAKGASAYAFEHTDHISAAPLRSSGYDIFDGDVPFYQMVLHGLIPYSSVSVNGDPDPESLILMAAASGSGISYDFIGSEASELKDTVYDKYYYADSGFWLKSASDSQRFIKDILYDLKDEFITGYSVNGNIITTVYSNGTTVKTDTENGTVVSGSRKYVLKDYLEGNGGVIG